jgi:twinkle protein
MFDMDKPGRDAAQEAAELLPIGKVKIAKLPRKDANECLVAGEGQAIISAFWNAEPYRPDGIVSVRDIKATLFQPVTYGAAWPWTELTRLTYGRKKKHLYAFGAGVGVGKTDVFTECIAYDLVQLKQKVGVIYLEQPVDETVQRVAGKMKSKLFHVPDAGWTETEYREAIDELDALDALWLYQHFGSKDWNTVAQKIRYFNKALGIEHIYLDHLTALVSTAEDERRALDRIMAEMAGLAHELDIVLHFISHLTTPDGKPHEEGGRVHENQFTGSRAIARWSHYMIGLERNKQADDPVERCTTTVRILKDRWTGRAGGCTFPLHYNQETGRLTESTF